MPITTARYYLLFEGFWLQTKARTATFTVVLSSWLNWTNPFLATPPVSWSLLLFKQEETFPWNSCMNVTVSKEQVSIYQRFQLGRIIDPICFAWSCREIIIPWSTCVYICYYLIFLDLPWCLLKEIPPLYLIQQSDKVTGRKLNTS